MDSDNKRIARNTFYMYLRMFVNMAVLLYTSRLIIEYLGVSDFGIYNVVGGVVVVFSFISTSMTSSTSRFLSFSLGKKDYQEVDKVFSTTIFLHICLSILVIVLSETIGLWYVNNYLVFPHERISIVHFVFQFSVFNTVFMIMTIPYSSLIMSNERMNVYAFISLFDVFMKLFLTLYLGFTSYDRLLVYACGLMFLGIIVMFLNIVYVRHKKLISIWSIKPDRSIVKQLLSYSGWSLIGNMSSVCNTQGLNLVLNYFFGNIVNAAFGITSRVLSAINSLSGGFQVSLNPQITKSYSAGNLPRHFSLVCNSAKYSFFLIIIIAIPIFFNIDTILRYWLVNYPEETPVFVQLIMLTSIMSTIGNPFGVSVDSTGKIKKMSIIISVLNVSVLPVSIVVLYLFKIPYLSLIVNFVLTFVCQCVKLRETHRLTGMQYKDVFDKALKPIIKVAIPSVIIPYVIYSLLNKGSFLFLCINVVLMVLSISLIIYIIGLSKEERQLVNSYIKTKLLR